MKKSLITILFLTFAACSPGCASYSSNTPVATKTTIVSTILPQATRTDHSFTTTVSIETAAATSTALPSPTSTFAVDEIVERAYDPGEWNPLYDKDTVWQIELDPEGRMWVYLSGGEIGFFDGSRWIFFSPKDYLLPDQPFDMAIAPDGTVWLAGRHAISRYRQGHWEIFPMPGVSETAFPRMAIDSSSIVWVTMSSCPDCDNLLKKFDGKNWNELQLWTVERGVDIPQILFTPDGVLWAADDGGEIGRYDGNAWKSYSEMDLWSTDKYAKTIRIAADNKGNIFGVYSGQFWVIKIDTNSQVSKIPYPTNLRFNETLLRLFVDGKSALWVNACLKDKQGTCLAYYKNNQWTSFTNLPFNTVFDIKELPDGTLLFATSQGLYQFKSAK